MSSFTRRTDVFSKAGCYVPRFYHAPDSGTQFAGLAPNGYLTYLLSLPIGSFILGFLHTTSSVPGSVGDSPGALPPPTPSGFTCQITDQAIDHKWFSRPAEEAWFINDAVIGA